MSISGWKYVGILTYTFPIKILTSINFNIPHVENVSIISFLMALFLYYLKWIKFCIFSNFAAIWESYCKQKLCVIRSFAQLNPHYCKKYHNLTLFPGVEILWKGTVFRDSPETMRKLWLSTKFPHREIRWNYGIFHRRNLSNTDSESNTQDIAFIHVSSILIYSRCILRKKSLVLFIFM